MMSSGVRRQVPKRRARPKKGIVMVVALVCLLIVMAMLGQMLLGVVRSGRQLHRERDRRQCELLLQAGMERAAYRLAEEPEYSGETWAVESADILGQGAGEVTIERKADENAAAVRLLVTAEYPTGSEHSVRRSRSLLLPTKQHTLEE